MPQTCPQCQSEATDEAGFCPSCGAALRAATAAAAGRSGRRRAARAAAATAAPAGAAAGASAVPAYKFDAARWSLADRIAGVATIVLFISLFLPWFSVIVIGITVTAQRVVGHGWLYLVDDPLHPDRRLPGAAGRVGRAPDRVRTSRTSP